MSTLKVNNVEKLDGSDLVDLVPTGSIIAFGGSTVPSAWLECDGQSTSGYPALASIVGSNVPDLRGEFLRGWDNGRGVDSGRAIRSTQDEEIKSHNHSYNRPTFIYNYGSDNGFTKYCTGENNETTGDEGGDETRPRNVAVMYIIKT